MSLSVPGAGTLGFPQALTLLFIGLRLTGHIDWSWWWVLSPMIILIVGSVIRDKWKEHLARQASRG